MGTRINYEVRGAHGALAAVLYSNCHHEHEEAEVVFRELARDALGPSNLVAALLERRYGSPSGSHGEGARMFFLDISLADREKVLAVTFHDDMSRTIEEFPANVPAHARWLPISDAPKGSGVLLVNDTNQASSAPWAAARWLSCEGWSGWVYDDDALSDCMPLGPQPTHFLDGIPPLPGASA